MTGLGFTAAADDLPPQLFLYLSTLYYDLYKKKQFIFLLMNSTWNFKIPKSLCVCVCVCVRERERERETETETETEIDRQTDRDYTVPRIEVWDHFITFGKKSFWY